MPFTYHKPIDNIILNGECFLPKIGNKARMSALTAPIQHHTRSLSQCNKARKRNTVMCHITMFWSTTDHIYDSGSIRLIPYNLGVQ